MTEEQYNLTLSAMRQVEKRSDDEGVIMFESANEVPHFDFPYMVEYVAITLCENGNAKGFYNMRKVSVSKGDLTLLLPGQLISYNETSPDFRSVTILMTERYALNLRQKGSLKVQLMSTNHFVIHLRDDEFQAMNHCFGVMRYLLSHMTEGQEEAVVNLFGLMSHLFNNFENFKSYPEAEKSHQEHVFERFYHLVTTHYRQSRKVIWYADKLCITPKYLSTVIKVTTGKSAVTWIDDYVILKAKLLLSTQKLMTIQEIADYMGFEDQAIFSKFFKKQTGKTPTAYREW